MWSHHAPQRLTPREHEIALLLADGLKLELIAERLGLSAHTVKVHITHIRQRLRLANQDGVVSWIAARRVPGNPDMLRRAGGARVRDQQGDMGYLRRAEQLTGVPSVTR